MSMSNFKHIFRHKTAWIILLIMALALALRLYNLYKYDLWFDEVISNLHSHEILDKLASKSGKSVPQILFEDQRSDPQPFLYYLLIYLCSFFLKIGRALRLISVVFSMLSLFVFYKLGRLVYGRQTGIAALLLMAVNPFHLWYAQEMRVYAASCFFVLLAVFFFVKILTEEKKIYWLYFFISGLFAIFTNYYSLFLFVAAFFFLLLKKDLIVAGKFLLFIVAVFLFFLPLSHLVLQQMHIVKNLFWLRPPEFGTLFMSFAVFGSGYSADHIPLIIGTSLLAALFVYGVYRSLKENNELTFFLLLSFFLPIIIIFMISRAIIPIYIDRQFIVITPFYYLFIAHGISGLRNVKLKLFICLGLTILMASLLINYYNGFMISRPSKYDFYTGVHQKKQYGPLIDYLYANLNEEDIVAATDIQSYMLALKVRRKLRSPKSYGLLFYPKTMVSVERTAFGSELREFLKTSRGSNTEGYMHMVSVDFGRIIIEREPLINKDIKRIWLITSFWDKAGFSPVNNSYKAIRNSLLGYRCKESKNKDGLILEEFEKE